MRILSAILIGTVLLSGNEIERIESIVNDVTKLRHDYEQCQSALQRLQIPEEQQLVQQDGVERDLYEREIARLQNELAASEKRLALLETSLNDANEKTAHLKQQLAKAEQQELPVCEKSVTAERVIVKWKSLPCPDPNPFPKLLMKEEYQQMKANDQVPSEDKEVVNRMQEAAVETAVLPGSEPKSTYFKPRAFRVQNAAKIYDSPNGKVIDTWEARTSFTSGERRGAWIRITGYFVDQKWQPTKEKVMWVEADNTIMR